MTREALRFAAAAALAALTAGCGSGSGGIVASSAGGGTGPSPPRPSCIDNLADAYAGDCEYRRAWGLAAVNAATAYERIAQRDGAGTAPGAGARVAVIDTGIAAGHWEFDSSRVTETCYTLNNCGDGEHGTAVSSIIAARRNQAFPAILSDTKVRELSNFDFHGIAWGIDHLKVLSIPLGSADPNRNYQGIDPADVDNNVAWLAARFFAVADVDFVNMSFGVNGLVENYLNETFGVLYAPAISTLAQTSTQTGKTVLVVAASNDHGDKCEAPEPNCVGGSLDASSPAIFAGLPVLEESLRSHMVAVVATDRQGRITSFSNRCGIAAKWCIAAPGDRMPVALYEKDEQTNDVRVGYASWRGTSFAAPHVTGGLAVMKHWFRSQMANEGLLERLYETARVTPDPVAPGDDCPEHLDLDGNLSDCELSSTLGRGLMDLGAATAPVGVTSIALGSRVAGGGPAARSSWVAPGQAMGDGMRRSLAGRQMAVFDTLGAPFWIDAARFVHSARPPDPGARLLRWLVDEDGANDAASVSDDDWFAPAGRIGSAGTGLRFGYGAAPGGTHMSLASRPAAANARFGNAVLSAFASTGSGGETGLHSVDGDTHGLALSWKPAHERAGLHAGWIRETETLFGSNAGGAFGRLSSDLSFVGASGTFEAGGWRFDMAAELGHAMPDAVNGLLADTDTTVVSSGFSAKAARPLAGGTLRLSLQQPLRIESGHLHLSLPIGRTPEGTVRRQRIPVSMEPSGRQLDFGIDWTEPVAPGAVWRIGAMVSHEPGHEAGGKSEALVLAGLRVAL